MAKGGSSKGFTLIELLIVVVVIATLMGMIFRLAGVGGDQKARNTTITRLQKLEFALSGYFAAFGSYPPVPLHGTRDIFCAVNEYGIQMIDGSDQTSKLEWPRVRAACLSQPVACEFPFNSKDSGVKAIQQAQCSQAASSGCLGSGSVDLIENASMFPNRNDLASIDKNHPNVQVTMWQKVQIFKFGVMSFLTPRWTYMVAGPYELYDRETYCAPWESQNDLKTLYRFSDGRRLYSAQDGWKKLQEDTSQRKDSSSFNGNEKTDRRFTRILMQPSQAVCARWMEALDGIVSGGMTFFGVNTCVDHRDWHTYEQDISSSEKVSYTQQHPYYVASRNGPQNGMGGMLYKLNGMTVRDGWGEDLFYYSPPPYQSYRLWSAGPNRKTIPPWVELESLRSVGGDGGSGNGQMTAANWVADDIVGLSTPAD